ncbi:sugar transferase, partial [Bacillaceae bacterium HSR45]|nr:sugar transferase [Bacillaceae bacterium HSR45]
MLAKRFFDLALSVILLVALSPAMILTACLIRWKIGSPVLFRQTRPGLNGEPFTLYKFRTMTDERDAAGNLLSDEKRLTKTGRLIRKTSLDELPQLINVIKGDLSLVGPRPLLMEYIPLYTKRQWRRHEVKPGITGWAQINGR